MFFKSVNSLQSHQKSSAQLCHQELVEQLQHFKLLCFTWWCNKVFKKWWEVL